MKTLDRTRPFGIVSPPHNGIHFQQDGIDFDSAGDELASKTAKPAATASATPPANGEDPAADPFPGSASPFLKLRAWAKRHGFEGSKKDELTAWLTINGHV